jgi:hypothetical protein
MCNTSGIKTTKVKQSNVPFTTHKSYDNKVCSLSNGSGYANIKLLTKYIQWTSPVFNLEQSIYCHRDYDLNINADCQDEPPGKLTEKVIHHFIIDSSFLLVLQTNFFS